MKRWACIIAACLFLWLVGTHPTLMGAPAVPPAPSGNDCQVTVTTSGTPPPGVKSLDLAKICDAVHRAEQQASR